MVLCGVMSLCSDAHKKPHQNVKFLPFEIWQKTLILKLRLVRILVFSLIRTSSLHGGYNTVLWVIQILAKELKEELKVQL